MDTGKSSQYSATKSAMTIGIISVGGEWRGVALKEHKLTTHNAAG